MDKCIQIWGASVIYLGLTLPLVPSMHGALPMLPAVGPEPFHGEHGPHTHDEAAGHAGAVTLPAISSSGSGLGTIRQIRASGVAAGWGSAKATLLRNLA
jgi:hypothetical protein